MISLATAGAYYSHPRKGGGSFFLCHRQRELCIDDAGREYRISAQFLPQIFVPVFCRRPLPLYTTRLVETSEVGVATKITSHLWKANFSGKEKLKSRVPAYSLWSFFVARFVHRTSQRCAAWTKKYLPPKPWGPSIGRISVPRKSSILRTALTTCFAYHKRRQLRRGSDPTKLNRRLFATPL